MNMPSKPARTSIAQSGAARRQTARRRWRRRQTVFPKSKRNSRRTGPAFADALACGLPSDGVLLVVLVPQQRLRVLTRRGVWRVMRISTAANGLGNASGSNATPTGWHRAAKWIGVGAAAGQVFRSRRATRRVLAPDAWRMPDGEDLILSRIIWLAGLEPGVNQGPGIDSFARYIYLHGTNHEQWLGTPASHGCIRMANRDIVDLCAFAHGRETWCWIGLASTAC
jgi:L,D-transpeptidase YbiS